MTEEARRLPLILLVEDNLGDVELMRDALEGTGTPHQVAVARDGADAIAWLRREGEHRDAPRPDLVLLDLNLPRRDGKEVLADIKSDPDLRRIPVLIYTSSDAEEEVKSCYDLHANAYLTKATHTTDTAATFRAVVGFWLERARLPEA